MSGKNNKWWEFYYVRYFVGTIVGTIVVAALLFHPDSSIAKLLNIGIKQIADLKAEHFWFSAALGLAFCYIASAPILVFHTYRAHIEYESKIIFPKIEFFIILTITIGSYLLGYIFVLKGVNFWKNLIAIASVIFISSLQLSLTINAIRYRFEKVFEYYQPIVERRGTENPIISEYVESYRHLREHGNAFLIVLFEIMLGSALFVSAHIGQLIAIIIIWLIPSISVWFVGTYLERNIDKIEI